MNRACTGLATLTTLLLALLSGGNKATAGQNLVEDPSFEEPQPANQFGWVFSQLGRLEVRGRLRLPRRPGRP